MPVAAQCQDQNISNDFLTQYQQQHNNKIFTTQSVEAIVATAMPTEIIITDTYLDHGYLATQTSNYSRETHQHSVTLPYIICNIVQLLPSTAGICV